MPLRPFMLSCLLTVLSAVSMQASPLESILQQLREQGYVEIEVERTLLGRIRIEADGVYHEREIILNRRSFEILRDYSLPNDDAEEHPAHPPKGLFKHD